MPNPPVSCGAVSSSRPPIARRFGVFVLSWFLVLFAVAAVAQQGELARKDFNIASDEASRSLKQFAVQSGEQLLYSLAEVEGVKTLAVRGNMTSRVALERMLEGTLLIVAQDRATGALAVRREDPDAAKNAVGRPADGGAARAVVRDGAVQMDKYEVTGQRVSGLVNEGVIPRQEGQALAFVVLGRNEIEAMGATDINEVFRTLPQVASFESESQSLLSQRGFATFGAGVTPATKIDMRGFTSAGTTILVNGRRLPLVRETQNGGPDVGRIPLSAIERIEVLPSSAGGMYGTNSMGGVINVILRKEYTGRELTASFAMATAGGAEEVGLTYTEGRAMLGGRANLTWTVDLRDRQPMFYRDRPFYRSFLNVNPPPNNGGDLNNWVNTGGMTNFPSVPGVIVARSNVSPFGIIPLDIPGATAAVNYAIIPEGQNGVGLTPASFLPGANRIAPRDIYGGFALFNPSKSANLNATFNHELLKDRLSWYAELGLGYSDTKSNTPPQGRSLTLLPTDPRNPFRTGVVPGYAGQRVQLYYHPSDLPGTFQHTRNITVRTVLGLNGKFSLLGHDWTWAVDGSSDYNARKAFGYTPDQLMNSILNAAATNPLAQAFYNPFNDPIARPNTVAAGKLAKTSFRQNDDYVWLGSGVIRVNGAVADLPAGPVAVSFLGEYNSQWYENVFKNRADESIISELGLTYGPSLPFPAPSPNFVWSGTTNGTERATGNAGTEVVVPVLGKDFTFLGIHALELMASTSRSQITDAKPFSAHNVGFRFAPVRDAALRVSYGSGTYPPQEFMLTDSTFTDIIGATTPDPRRGNTAIGNYTSVGGGNPDLLPEQTETWNIGLVLEPRFVPGLSATFDYGFIEKQDGITSIPLATLLANEAFFPERVSRATPTAAEAALGWAGQVTRADLRRFNTGNIWTQYLDTSVRYQLVTRSLGTFSFVWRSTNTREFKTRLRPNTPIIDTLDQILAPLKFRGSGSIAWRQGNWTVTPSWSYIESYRDAANVPVDNSLTTNLQVVYTLPAEVGARGWRSWLQGTQWTVGVNNLLDNEPPYVFNPGGQSFRSYYSTFDDPRGRYVYARIRKSF